MALLEELTNNYYKINVSRCYLAENNMLVVNADIYPTSSQRDKEKLREEGQRNFIRNCREFLLSLEENLINNYSDQLLDEYSEASSYFQTIEKSWTIMSGDNIKEIEAPSQYAIDAMSSLGYEEEWVTDPVIKGGNISVYINIDLEDAPEIITAEFCYNTIKRVMSETLDI